jgi:hypothetical protein
MKKSILRIFLGFIILSLSWSCLHLEVIPLTVNGQKTSLQYPPIPMDKVVIFRSTKVDPAQFQEIGIITIESGRDLIDIYEIFRQKAADLGSEVIAEFKISNSTKIDNSMNDDGSFTSSETDVYTATGVLLRRKNVKK